MATRREAAPPEETEATAEVSRIFKFQILIYQNANSELEVKMILQIVNLTFFIGNTNEYKVFVGNLSYDTDWKSLKDFFRQIGDVLRADVF